MMRVEVRAAPRSRTFRTKIPPLLLLLVLSGCAGSQTTGGIGPPHPDKPAALELRLRETLEVPAETGFFDPGALTVDSRDRVLVADRSRGAVFVYNGSGPPDATLADPPPAATGSARFQDVRSIVATSGLNVYVLDAGVGRVYSYDLANQLRGTVLDLESAPVEAAFGRVKASAFLIDRTGQPVVVDREGDRLLVFSPQWEPSHTVGGPGMAAGGFRDPVAIATDDRGRLYVADRGNRLVQVFSQSGAFLFEKELEHAPESIAVTPGGDMVVGDSAGFLVVLPASGGRTLVTPGDAGSGPVTVSFSPDGRRLYAARSVRGVVQVIDVLSPGASP